MHKYLYIAAGGAAGSLCRYLVSGVTQRMFATSFPIGTFSVNMIGCLFFGLVTGLFEERLGLPPEMRLLILTGFMGAFTTFSTYMFESTNLIKSGQWAMTALNIGGQSILGFACIVGGLALGRLIVS
ncbi:fluoride efflux transporter CrcB [Maridesulfovibrio salexigens]|uniref:Fluoride-specific ion channel FluC n=1 Tax=Maridesulfovibrio salexigens (strain ATCC 14822 / DSM 2638 / NCIMB 8403 / VKM B-1763) TaxID=526222 RepID=FLUC_MARSD|nr:fluoride efflux transporter CrcB [Maridesulfovibrio salexigens]C6BTV9.1 RecName: Full=Fluoride-specific ion channel FluC [Maridesulfovibrio salexigens DSM 2638]ACS79889.1 CrcB protein [Maridesulfovibrio salexigens DSM 2638]